MRACHPICCGVYRPICARFRRYSFDRNGPLRRLIGPDHFVNNSLSGFSSGHPQAAARRQTSAVRQLVVAEKAAPDEILPVSESDLLPPARGNTSIGRVNAPRPASARAGRESAWTSSRRDRSGRGTGHRIWSVSQFGSGEEHSVYLKCHSANAG